MFLSTQDHLRSIMSDCDFSKQDIGYALKRLAAEGHIFLVTVLPKISKCIIRSLEEGFFNKSFEDLHLFFRSKNSLISFGFNILSKIFDPYTGCLHSGDISPFVLQMRQVCEYFYKLAIPYTDEQTETATENFINNEKSLKELGESPEVARFSEQLRKDFETYYPEISGAEVHDVFDAYRPRSTNGTFVSSDCDYYLYRDSETNEGFLASGKAFEGYYKAYPALKKRELKGFCAVGEGDFSELLLVPKDSRGPRTICREAIKRLETQMAYFDFMCTSLTRSTEGAINFIDQTVNRRIAEESSVSRNYATLDLKDASDRVSYGVVKDVFRYSPGLFWFITGDRRASRVLLPSGKKSRLYKLAGMGSGLTFPTMSLLISLAICNKVKKRFNLPYEYVRKNVFVYGDDICVPRNWYATAISALDLIGLKVNVSKSFSQGHFRESCGADFFAGHDVAPVRIKLSNAKPTIVHGGIETPDSPNAFVQIYAHVKELHKKGLLATAKYVMSVLRKAHLGIFNVQMTPGSFQDDSDLITDFYRGTRHHCLDSFIRVLTIVPSKRKYDRPILSENGLHVYKRSSRKYLGSFLKVTACTTDREKSIENARLSHLNIGSPRSFSEITIPRALEFRFKEVRAEFLTDIETQSREFYVLQQDANRQNRAIAQAMFYLSTSMVG